MNVYPALPQKDSRVNNTFYTLPSGEVRYWIAGRLNCKHRRNITNCKECIEETGRKIIPHIAHTIETVRKLFTDRGFILKSTEYVDSETKYDYECICGNTECSITIGSLRAGHDNCKPCVDKKTKATLLQTYGTDCIFKNEEMKEKIKQTMIEKYGCAYAMQNKEIQTKTGNTMMERYGVKYTAQHPELLEKMKQSNLEKFGVEFASQNEQIKEKTKQTMNERYGVDCPIQNKEIQEKMKQTNNERYGCDYTGQSKEIQEKIKQTNNERYGCDYPAQNKEIQEKMKEAVKELYGVDNVMELNDIREKWKKSVNERYGCDYPMQNNEVKEKFKQTVNERYGVDHPMQNPEIFAKYQQSSFQTKPYTFIESSVEIQVQGYEPFAYDILLAIGISESELICGYYMRNEFKIMYQFEGKEHRYYPDIYIPSENKFIEVKSQYIYQLQIDQNTAKMKATRALGFEIAIWIFGRNGELIEWIDKF